MRLTLLCGANPAMASRGPTVRVQAGRWRFHLDSFVDSTIVVEVGSQLDHTPINHGDELVFDRAETVTISLRNRGKERYISVFLERVA